MPRTVNIVTTTMGQCFALMVLGKVHVPLEMSVQMKFCVNPKKPAWPAILTVAIPIRATFWRGTNVTEQMFAATGNARDRVLTRSASLAFHRYKGTRDN